ncbi:MAG TPA: hypothetical protein VG860_10765 [Terriglobia bacterium]|jgi:hypothetical protein|nr:hypothetical protein [Terriglobia bacterium]
MPYPTRAIAVRFIGQKWRMVLSLAAALFAGCAACGAGASESQAPTGDHAVDQAVRAFMQSVAHDVTQDGPMAWIKYFDEGPAFFMAVNGQMAFPNAAAAQQGTRKFAQTISHIELKWGDDLRVDPLTADLAVVAASWHETLIDTAGHREDDAGYFTGLAENRKGRWQFRDAHWSAPVPAGH